MAETVSAYREAVACETRTCSYSLASTITAFAGNRIDLVPEDESFNLVYLFSVLFGNYSRSIMNATVLTHALIQG